MKMIGNVVDRSEQGVMKQISANFRDGVIIDEYMWVYDNAIQGICKIDLYTYELELVKAYQGKQEYIVSWIFRFDDILFLVGMFEKAILAYDMEKNVFFSIKMLVDIDESKIKIQQVIRYKDVLWMLPQFLSSPIICFDMKMKEYKLHHTLITSLARLRGPASCQYSFASIEGNCLYIPSWYEAQYIRYNIETGQCKTFDLKNMNLKLNSIYVNGEKRWVSLSNSSDIVYVNMFGKERRIAEGTKGNRPYAEIYHILEYLIYLPGYGNEIVLVNTKTEEVIRYTLDEEIELKERPSSRMRNICYKEDKIYFIPFNIDKLYILDLNEKDLREMILRTSLDYTVKKIEHYIKRGDYVREMQRTSLIEFLDYVTASEN